jgi:hypothetical protein
MQTYNYSQMNTCIEIIIPIFLIVVTGVLILIVIEYIKIKRAGRAWQKADKEYRAYYKIVIAQAEDHSLYKIPITVAEILGYEEDAIPDTKKLLANNPHLYELLITNARAGVTYCKLCPEDLLSDENKYEKLTGFFFLIEDEKLSSELSALIFN